ncbi:MAG: Type 1 glutamine amidotransferase-like domain-containing protein [Patescibacteria group bacterium]
MTKYFLHGGEFHGGGGLDTNYFSHLFQIDKNQINVLAVYFARPLAKWDYLFEEDSRLMKSSTDKSIEIRMASIDSFAEDLEWADVVFYKGGDGPRLTEALSHFGNLREKYEGKNIGGTSAGANAHAKYYYSRIGDRVIKGLGVINFNVFTHYEDKLGIELQKLREVGENLQIITIPEGEFVIVETK